MKYLSFLMPFKLWIMGGTLLAGLLGVGVTYSIKKYKEHREKQIIKKAKMTFEDCAFKSKNNAEFQYCFLQN